MFSMLSVDESHLHLRPEQTWNDYDFQLWYCYSNSATDLVENEMPVNWIAANDLINEFLFWDWDNESENFKV